MYEAMTRHHTSMGYSAEELHAKGPEIVDQVLDEIVDTGFRLFGTTDVPEIFERLSDPPCGTAAARRCSSTPSALSPPPS